MAAPNDDELAPYFIENLLYLRQRKCKGAGCYGAVYEVSVSGCPCIAKRLHDILVEQAVSVEQKSSIRSRFREECILLSKLRHPNVVQFVGVQYGKTQNDLTLVMEALYIDLDRCLAEQKSLEREIPLPIQLAILLDVSYGLLYLHSQCDPIIHRDLTASNILLTRDMRAKIADLGMSKILDLHLLRSAAQTVCPGALGVMPPEALAKHPQYDVKLDIFSFGTLVLHMANHEFPVPYEVPVEDCQRGMVSVTRRRDAVDAMGKSHCLHQLVCRCLHDDPKKRPVTADITRELEKRRKDHPRQFEDVLEMCDTVNQLRKSMRVMAEENEQLQKENGDLLQKLKSESVQYEKKYEEKKALFEEHAVSLKRQVEDFAERGDRLEEKNRALEAELAHYKREFKEETEMEMSLFNQGGDECDVRSDSGGADEGYVILEDQIEVGMEALKYSKPQPKKAVLESQPPSASYSECSSSGGNGLGTEEEVETKNKSCSKVPQSTSPQQLLAGLKQYAAANDYHHLLGVEQEASMERLEEAWRANLQELRRKDNPERREMVKHEAALTWQLFQDVFGSEDTRKLYGKLCHYRKMFLKIPDQDSQRLKSASEKLQVFYEAMSATRMPLKLLEEVQLAQSLVELCLQHPEA